MKTKLINIYINFNEEKIMPKEEKKKYLEDEFKTTIAKQVNAYLMEKGMTPLENADWLKKDDLLNIVRNFKIETETPLKKY